LTTRFQFIIAALLLLAGPAVAAEPPVRITAVRVGFPGTDVAKFACWAPVYVDLESAGTVSEPAELLIESADPDEITTALAVPLNLGGSTRALGYVRPGGVGEVTVTVRAKDGGKPLSEPFRVRSLRPRDPLTYVVLSLGSPLPGFDLPRPTGAEQPAGLRGGRVELGTITDFAQLPDQWFGYEAADLVVLNTGNGEFLQKLFGDGGSDSDRGRRAALVEWVRRGGRLVVGVGANAASVAKLPALQELLPQVVNPAAPARDTKALVLYWSAREGGQTSNLSGALGLKSGTFPVADLAAKPDRPARVLIPPPGRQTESKEVAGQHAFGLGKVTVIGFDLDRAPFTEFGQRPEFWDWVLREGGANRASAGSEGKPRSASAALGEEEDELAVALRTHADAFDGVPVVSFGWLAILIVFYILLIGPIEYYFLRRVLGRLELTWVTFPVIVLTVSLLAYYSAYSIKGRELKINKLDVIDIDPASGRVYGTTQFTIFSPRIDNYTLSVTPAEGWAAETEPAGTMVSWLGGPGGGRASLLRRRYDYHSDALGMADGLDKVPVQVWSTKSFVANWSAPSYITPPVWQGQPGTTTTVPRVAVVESRLEHPPGDRSAVIGTFVNHLPVPVLSDCVVFYAGQAYPLPGGTIRSGETVRLILDKGTIAAQWLQKESGLEGVLQRVQSYAERPGAAKNPQAALTATPALGGALPLWGLLFHEAALPHAEGVIARNASLRRLDQSWRLTPDNQGEVVLVGRATPPVGPAEETLSGPNAPSRLWLKGHPGEGASRTPIPGTGRQETWVRVYLPVR
jgi:hypothetical protein